MVLKPTEPSVDWGAVPGVVFWVLFGAVVVFFQTHRIWYDTWDVKERIDFWVAIGTGALALATGASVLVTMFLMATEHRRHRQRIAPIIRIQLRGQPKDSRTMVGLEAKNVGLGPALHISVVAEYDDAGKPGVLRDEISALAVHESRSISNDVTRVPRPMNRKFYRAITVRYSDMFSNEYAMIYSDFGQLQYELVQPTRLH